MHARRRRDRTLAIRRALFLVSSPASGANAHDEICGVARDAVSFLNLWALWIAAAALPALLILYFLKLRRREERVPSTLLWKRAVQDLQVNAPFQRLRKNLLLFLQMLLLIAGIIALARPIVKSEVSDERSLVLLIDRSASMNALEGQKTRLELAKEQAKRLVQTLNRRTETWFTFGPAERTRCMVIALADRPSIISPFTTNTSELQELIEAIRPTDARTNLREALELAEAYIVPTRGGVLQNPEPAEIASKMVLISDGRVADAADLTLRYGTLELLRIGEASDNVGIVAMRAQRKYEQPQWLDVFVQVQNFGPQAIESDLSLLVEGAIVDVQSVSLGPQPQARGAGAATQTADASSSASLSFSLPVEKAATLEARLAPRDALAVDNSAFAVVPAPRRLSVLLVSKKNFFLERLLRAMPLAKFDYWTPEQYEARPASELELDGRSVFDVIVIDRHDTRRLPAGNYFFIAGLPQGGAVQRAGELADHAMLWWDETHAILRHVALDFVFAARGMALTVPSDAEVLVEGPHGPVLLRYAADGRQFLLLSFAIEDSNWWSKLSFPVFFYNALRYLGSGADAGESGAIRPGDTLRAALPAGVSEGQMLRPDGLRTPLRVDGSGTARFALTERVGVYRVEPGLEERDRFAVNLEDPQESLIAPVEQLKLGAETVAEAQAVELGTPEIWRWFIGAAFFLALVEWYIYNRRVML